MIATVQNHICGKDFLVVGYRHSDCISRSKDSFFYRNASELSVISYFGNKVFQGKKLFSGSVWYTC